MINETLRKKLESGNLTDMDVLAILDWQLSLPAEEMDCGLISECDLFLAPNAPGLSSEQKDALLAGVMARISGVGESVPSSAPQRTRRQPPVKATHRARPRKALLIALITVLLLALAVGGVAYSVHRGVLNFTEDFGFAKMVSQEGAEEFVSSGTLAHLELEHVDVDVLEAVYDGADLRVVYSLTDHSGEVHMAEHSSDAYVMPGEGEVTMCDYILVNGQDAYFNNDWEAPGDNPGQMLYYLQTNLPAWGVDVTGAEELTIGLPMFPLDLENPGSRRTLDFTISAVPPEGLVRHAAVKEASADGHSVYVVNSVFSPLNGYVELFYEGLTREYFYAHMNTLCEVYAVDGSILTSSYLEGPVHSESEFEGKQGMSIGFSITPTEGAWPDEMIVALEMEDYSPDWEVTLLLDPLAAEASE